MIDIEDGTFVLAASLDPCLMASAAASWRRYTEKLTALAEHDPNAREARRWYLGNSFTVSLDGHGRILVPPALREWAGVQREVTWVGVGERLELWDPERLAAWSQEFRSKVAGVAAWLAGKGL